MQDIILSFYFWLLNYISTQLLNYGLFFIENESLIYYRPNL